MISIAYLRGDVSDMRLSLCDEDLVQFLQRREKGLGQTQQHRVRSLLEKQGEQERTVKRLKKRGKSKYSHQYMIQGNHAGLYNNKSKAGRVRGVTWRALWAASDRLFSAAAINILS